MSNYRIYLSKTVILASKDVKDGEMDKRTLKSLGFTTDLKVFTSGIELALFLVDIDISHLERHYIVLCNPKLKDMTAKEFIDLIRLHPLNIHQPVIAMSTSENETASFQDMPFTKVVQRPSSMQVLEDALTYATRYEQQKRKQIEQLMSNPDFYFSSKDFFSKLTEHQKEEEKRNPDAVLERLSPAQALYAGYDLLRDKHINKAIPTLLKALADENVVPQASVALARAYAASGKPDLVRKYLCEAIIGFAFLNNDDKMLNLASRYKERFVNLEHPLINDIGRYVETSRLKDFMKKLILLNDYYPLEEESSNLIRVCLQTKKPVETAKEMGEALPEDFKWMADVINTSVERTMSGKADPKKKKAPDAAGAKPKPVQANIGGTKPEKPSSAGITMRSSARPENVGAWKPKMNEGQKEKYFDEDGEKKK